jgi:hypothetical protein
MVSSRRAKLWILDPDKIILNGRHVTALQASSDIRRFCGTILDGAQAFYLAGRNAAKSLFGNTHYLIAGILSVAG